MDERTKQTVMRWWQSMMLPTADLLKESGVKPAPSAHKAQLRRCGKADEAMLTEGFRALWLSLGPQERKEEGLFEQQSQAMECWAAIAMTLVHVRHDSKERLATAAGKKAEGDNSVVSELRFSQLQSAKTPDEFVRRLRRIVLQLKGELSVVSLAQDIYQWFAEHYQFLPRKADKRIAVRWAMDYYRAASGYSKH